MVIEKAKPPWIVVTQNAVVFEMPPEVFVFLPWKRMFPNHPEGARHPQVRDDYRSLKPKQQVFCPAFDALQHLICEFVL
jgi:hypothetical protein